MTSDSPHDLLVAKGAALACMFCATCIFGSIPYMLNAYFKWTEKGMNARSTKVVTWLLYFGGGVLLATTFIHILPDVEGVVSHLQQCNQILVMNFAIAEVLMCAGFFLMYLIEEVVHIYLHKPKKVKKDDEVVVAAAAFERGYSIRRSVLVKGDANTEQDNTAAAAYDNTNYQESNDESPDLKIEISLSGPPICNNQPHTLEHSKEHSHKPSLDHSHNYSHEHSHDHDAGHGHSHMPVPASDNETLVRSSLRGLGIVLALSLHECFEGLAIGLQDTVNSVWFLFAAVSAHKLVLAFCVGVELIVARTRAVLAVIYIVTFAIVSPIGVAIGIGISHNAAGSEDSITSMVLQGIACGTLLYVVFFEILNKQHAGLGAFIAMLVGFALMFGLQNIGEFKIEF